MRHTPRTSNFASVFTVQFHNILPASLILISSSKGFSPEFAIHSENFPASMIKSNVRDACSPSTLSVIFCANHTLSSTGYTKDVPTRALRMCGLRREKFNVLTTNEHDDWSFMIEKIMWIPTS